MLCPSLSLFSHPFISLIYAFRSLSIHVLINYLSQTRSSKHTRSSTWAPGSSPNRSLKRSRRPLPLTFLNPPSQPPSPSAERSESISLKKSSSTIGRKKSNSTIQLKHSGSNSAMNALRSLSTKPSRTFQSARLILDFSSSRPCSPIDDTYDVKKKHREFEFAPSSLPQEEIRAFSPLREKGSSTPPPDRTLRRKKHVSIFRSSAPPASASAPIAIELTMHHSPPQRQSSHSDTKVLTNTSDISPQTPTSDVDEFGMLTSDSRPQTPSSPNSDRLGSPTRPYYTAIRKNMPSVSHSRPNSVTLPSRPVSCPPPRPFSVLTSSPSSPLSPPVSALASIPDAEIYPLPRSSMPPPPSFGFGAEGCSVSGETELRMALGEMRYKDNRGNGSLVGRVKKLRKGLKEMLGSTSKRV
ncbi:hypothetical protein BDQ17DRAFT_218899 [Cyathus striatus]|nr:hypothetical protein BDQ17DRAFT_218899 [Cyathus striatus]